MATNYLINHCFLPPQLLQKDDSSEGNDHMLTELFQETLRAAAARAPPETGWKALISIPDLLLEQEGTLTEVRLVQSMGSMLSGGVLVLHIRAQNAGMIIRRENEAYVFESFELSPTTDQVTTTKGRLVRCFPGPAIAVKNERVNDVSFRKAFAQCVLQLSDQVVEDACPTSQKVGLDFVECRQTASPQYVTEMLTGFLRSVGQPHDVTRIQKHTRDEVLWHNALAPWRRSPRWLLLRVALQTSLKKKDEDQGRSTHYKMFMVLLFTNVLDRAMRESISGELLFIITAKISRRMLKLGSSADKMPWLDVVKLSMHAARNELLKRWNDVQNTPHKKIYENLDLQSLRQASDTHLQFRALCKYLEKIDRRLLNASDDRPSLPTYEDRILQEASTLPTACAIHTDAGSYNLWLLDLEAWVNDHLQTWISLNLVDTPSTTTCRNLATLMSVYFEVAKKVYRDDPQSFSIMVLTIMDMWVALDKCTISAEPLFRKYPTGFPSSIFDRLLLAKEQGMRRLFYIEQYLLLRRDEAERGYPLVFHEGNTTRSFAVAFFDQSPEHQQLKLEIEAAAAEDRERKLREFAKQKAVYENLMRQSNSKTCSTTSVTVGGRRNRRIEEQHVASKCSKCSLKSTAANMMITVHEWPLPSASTEAKAAVFELDVPDIVSIWRESTYAVLVDLFTADTAKPAHSDGKYMLLKSEGIQKWIKTKPGRIQLASSVKEVSRSHYGKQRFNVATQSTVCVENGLRCIMYDSGACFWTCEILGKHSLGRTCTLKLPPGNYKSLQYVLDGTQHTSNSIIANQDECPGSITLHELYSFSTLRAGHRLQWRNISRELVSRVLNFNHIETHLLVMQAAYEAGPSGLAFTRDSHVDLVEEDFGLSLLSAIEDGLGSVESNWQGATAVRTFTGLTTRLLSLSPHIFVRSRCLKFLDRARKVLVGWIQDVTELLHTSDGEEQQKRMAARILDLALSCYATFDIDECHLASIFSSAQNVSIAVESAVTIYDRCSAVNESRDASMAARMAQFVRCSRSIEETLRGRILTDSSGIDIAIRHLWSGYEPSGKWTALSSPNDRWVFTQTSAQRNRAGMTVHFNVLDGDFLVNGVPLTRLPRQYESHATYQRIFGGRILEVVPSQIVGMTFASRREIFGYQVHFHYHGSELIIRACKDGSDFELLPLRALHGDVPQAFIEDYAHWFDHSSGSIELRPIGTPWSTSPDNWRTETKRSDPFVLSQGNRKLMEMQSPIVQAIHQVLNTLEAEQHIHVVLTRTSKIEVHIPRMNLDFTIEQGSSFLESKQFRGMFIDRIQTFGSLTGLVTKLVLREALGSSRIVLVPDGEILSAKQDDHVRVHIDTGSARHISYHPFHIDSLLGRLVDNGSLHSRLFRVYLHAVTSYPLPDNLLGRTGTEEALHSLTQASTTSFSTFGEVETQLLVKIGSLSPIRRYYPPHLKIMETVSWSRLPSLQQHEKFFQVAETMKREALSLQALQETFVEAPAIDPRNFKELYERASIRLSNIRVDGYGAEKFTTQHDHVYAARDRIADSTREFQACSVSKQVDGWAVNSMPIRGLLSKFEGWGLPFSGKDDQSFPGLGFDRALLDPASKFLPAAWNTIQKTLIGCNGSNDRYRLMLFFATLAYSPNADQDIVQVLLAFATVPQLATIRMPQCHSINLSHGYAPSTTTLMEILGRNIRPFQNSSESRLPPLETETYLATVIRREDAFIAAADEKCEQFIQTLASQWPTSNLNWGNAIVDGLETYVNTDGAKAEVVKKFKEWHLNHQFREYITNLEAVLCTIASPASATTYSFQSPISAISVRQRYISFQNIIMGGTPSTVGVENCSPLLVHVEKTSSAASPSHRGVNLQNLLSRLSEKARGGYENNYISDLQKSFAAFTADHDHSISTAQNNEALVRQHLSKSAAYVAELYRNICRDLSHSPTAGHFLCHQASMSPRLSPTSILSHLAWNKSKMLPAAWKAAFVEYGTAITTLQRAKRLNACLSDPAELLGELANPGHVGWDPLDQPDWLLLELENDILIREEQAQIARHMISPSSGTNCIMQFNMGLGKSSVVLPMVAVKLADGLKLIRVVVLKSLSTQMFHLLQNKLGGMINRKIYYVPISRSLKLTPKLATKVRDTYISCSKSGGILLVLPEHILSFELLGLDYALSRGMNASARSKTSSLTQIGSTMINTQKWLLENSRDILDESDEILNVNFELIYTMGEQRGTEFSPDRWEIIPCVLNTLANVAQNCGFSQKFPNGLEIVAAKSGDGFPRLRILQPDAGAELLSATAREICENGLPRINVWNLSKSARNDLFRFITDPHISDVELQPLQETVLDAEPMKSSLLLLRGLFAGGVLNFAFAQKRWRVNYGLHLVRTRLAVPYQAKDSPSARAEFAHPDTTIVLSCLSYYYGGLSNKEIYAAFQELLQSDHPQEQYQEWIKFVPNMPTGFMQLNGINLSNATQCTRLLFPLLRFSKGLIDFYMSQLVFPKEMKEFVHKLSSSGWEIGRDKNHPTTGFSGTNDSKYVLPVSIKQSDLPQQLHTNAAVLDCLLRPENSVDSTLSNGIGVLNAAVLLDMAVASNPPVRVILDVGAQVLELENEEVARKWLSIVPPSDAQAAIYVDERNEICVVSRTGLTEPLQISPFAKLIDRCLVYLDEAHTRGIDLKMPSNYRAIVTLGPDLTKDRLAQACMRLRKLGKGQSVVFCASMEIQMKILQCCGKTAGDVIEVSDILIYCISNTWQYTKKSLPLWVAQGVRHYKRRAACATLSGLPTDPSSILEAEAQTLEQRYGPGGDKSHEQAIINENVGDPLLSPFQGELNAIRDKCWEFGLDSFRGVNLQEEQERELQPENEREQQVERPNRLPPQPHLVHKDVRDFATTGAISRFSSAFRSAFASLLNTSAGDLFEFPAWPQDLLVTADFAQTVDRAEKLDHYLRPVHWILTKRPACKDTPCVIVSPYEANELLPVIRRNANVTLHIYAPRLSLMNCTLEDLKFCAIPALPAEWTAPSIGVQLNLFAGQLYLQNSEEYLEVCGFLGLCNQAPPENVKVASDGFITPAHRKFCYSKMAHLCNFTRTPIPYLRAVFAMRRKGQAFASSHLGRILNGELLRPEHFVVPGSVVQKIEKLEVWQ